MLQSVVIIKIYMVQKIMNLILNNEEIFIMYIFVRISNILK